MNYAIYVTFWIFQKPVGFIVSLLINAKRDPDTADRLDHALEKISASQQLIRDEVQTAYIYGGTHHPHQVRSIVLSAE